MLLSHFLSLFLLLSLLRISNRNLYSEIIRLCSTYCGINIFEILTWIWSMKQFLVILGVRERYKYEFQWCFTCGLLNKSSWFQCRRLYSPRFKNLKMSKDSNRVNYKVQERLSKLHITSHFHSLFTYNLMPCDSLSWTV